MRYENHAVRFRQSAQSESRVEPGIHSRSEAIGRLWRYGLQGGASVGTPWFQEEDMEQEEVPSQSMSLRIALKTYNKLCAPFENKMREIYFYKEVCFVRSLKFVHYLWSCSLLGLWEVNNILIKSSTYFSRFRSPSYHFTMLYRNTKTQQNLSFRIWKHQWWQSNSRWFDWILRISFFFS